MGDSDRSVGSARRAHSEEYLAAQRKRSEGVSEEQLREAIASVGEDEVRELVREPRGTLGRIVRAAERIDPDAARGEYGGDGVEATARRDALRVRREALITIAGSEFDELRSRVGLDGVAGPGTPTKSGDSGGGGGSSEAYWMARAQRARGVSEREIRAAIAELGADHVRELLGYQRGTFGRLVGHAERAESPAGERAYRTLAAGEWNVARRLVGLEVDPERERRSCARWARTMADEGVGAGGLQSAVRRLGSEIVASVLDGAEPLFKAAVRRAADCAERPVKRSWVRIAACGPERVRGIVRGEQRFGARERHELYASSPDTPPAQPEVRVVKGRSRREVALSAVGPLLLEGLGL